MKEDIQETTTMPLPPKVGENGHGPDGAPSARPQGAPQSGPQGAPPAAQPKRRRINMMIVLPILAIVLAAAGYFGYQYWTFQNTYVSTDNAQISGSLVQVGAVNAGRVETVRVDIGDRVQQDQVVGTVLLPSTMGMTQSGSPLLGFVGTENQRAEIKSPISGVVVARSANPGDTIAAGQPVLTVTDPTKFYVQAQIEETKIGRVQIGQPVNVVVDSLGKTLQGRVTAINRASSATFSLLPSSNASGNFTKVTQLIPVRIALMDHGDEPLMLGSSVEVHIQVQ